MSARKAKTAKTAKTAKKTKRARRRGATVRLYYGPPDNPKAMYWTVPVSDAKKTVTISGSVAAVLRASEGVTIGCALSEVAMENEKQFGHPVLFPSFTAATALFADRLKKDGSPAHAIRYAHNYGKLVDMNDDGNLKKRIKQEPGLIERPLQLRPPRKRPTGPHRAIPMRSKATPILHVSPTLRGAMRRAVKAGRMSEHVAQHIIRAMKKRPVVVTPNTDAESAA